jgi:hypothetical protein
VGIDYFGFVGFKVYTAVLSVLSRGTHREREREREREMAES